jgi:hypothetical protein
MAMSVRRQIDCAYCGRENLSKDEIGLNRKIIHRQIERMMCLTCMAAYFDMTEERLAEKIEEFKRQGCALFG